MRNKIVQIHIPRTAGTSVRGAFVRAFGRGRVLSAGPGVQADQVDRNLYDVFTGHFGYHRAAQFEGDLVTVLRDPIDRLISYYYSLRGYYQANTERSRRTELAAKYELADFVCLRDDLHLIDGMFNAMTWQVAYGSTQQERVQLRLSTHCSDDTLLRTAMDNLAQFRLVGFQDNVDGFAREIGRLYDINFKIVRENATQDRPKATDLDATTIRHIHEWLHLDLEFFRRAQKEFGKRDTPPR